MVEFIILTQDIQEIPRKILLKLYELIFKTSAVILNNKMLKQLIFHLNDKPIIKTNLNSYTFDKAIIACGAFSKKLTDQMDEAIPLDTERGYHIHFKGS